ncbi:MAG: YbaN family protein [Candidatus Izemoplasmatales bacterium]|nr:YbaN family protein [Candidatus Izemoplasmatales bacterium]
MKPIYLTLGVLSVGMGVIGVILPVLPTTPFLLLAALLFSKSSEKIRTRFENSRFYQRHMKDFLENRTMTRRRKWTILIFADIVLTISFILAENTFLRIILILLFLTKHWYFYRYVKTENTEKKD